MFLTWKLLYGVSKTNTKLLNTKIYIKKIMSILRIGIKVYKFLYVISGKER